MPLRQIFLLSVTSFLAFVVPSALRADVSQSRVVIAKDIADIISMDPAESFEFTSGEILSNVYDRIMMFDPQNPDTLVGGVAESYEVSNNGRTFTFRVRDGQRFHSGNPVRPEDVEFSLERVIFLKKPPVFLLAEFGWNADNVAGLVTVVDEWHVRLTTTEVFSPGLVMNLLLTGCASVVDRELVMTHEVVLALWSPDYIDPNSNADAFVHNPDNRFEAQHTGILAWRNAWYSEAFNELTNLARNEPDSNTRRELYIEMQQRLQNEGPYVFLFQRNERIARRSELIGLESGPAFDQVYYRKISR